MAVGDEPGRARAVQRQATPFRQHPAQGFHQAFYEGHRPGGGEAGAGTDEQIETHRFPIRLGHDPGDGVGFILTREKSGELRQQFHIFRQPRQRGLGDESLQQENAHALVGGIVPDTYCSAGGAMCRFERHPVTSGATLGHGAGQGRPDPLPTPFGDDNM